MYHPISIALPCDSKGNFLPLRTPPLPHATTQQGDWSPFQSEAWFMLADLLYCCFKMLASNINKLLEIWAQSSAKTNTLAPFESRVHMYAIIDASKLSNVLWDVDDQSPEWMQTSYKVWYCDPEAMIMNMLANPDFAGQFDLQPYIDLELQGQHQWSDVLSGNIAWQHSDDVFMSDNSTKGSMYCPIILGSNKTTISVATGQVEYHPLYLSIGNPHNSVWCVHWNAVIPIAFLAILKGDCYSDDNPHICAKFHVFKCQLYHASVVAILHTLCPGMETPVVRQCPNGHFRCVIYDLVAFIADYPEQVLLTSIVQGWCPKCTASLKDFNTSAGQHTSELTDELVELLNFNTLWTDYGIDTCIVPFTSDFPHADIHEMISPDLLHQVIKGVFKNMVDWICTYVLATHGQTAGDAILTRLIGTVPSFSELHQFPQGHNFKQWTGEHSKGLMKVYLPAIVGYVPEATVKCLSTFLDTCYMVCSQDINNKALNDFEATLDRFLHYCKVFHTFGVRPKGFSLPRQHSLDFSAPGVSVVKGTYCCSNHHKAIGQMLLINQCLDKLATMQADFTEHSWLSQAHCQEISCIHAYEGPLEGNIVMSHVVLAWKCTCQYPETLTVYHYILCYVRSAREPDLGNLNIDVEEVPLINSPISIFHLAIAMFHAPSNPSAPSWRGLTQRCDCVIVVEDNKKPGMKGLNVVRLMLLFSFEHDNTWYSFALVELFKKVGLDPVMGMWIVCPDIVCGQREQSVIHLDSLLCATYLIPVFGSQKLP
ncbi:hypothetical protein EI94DRAFT_1769618 [Lactarius quietus]|nr:hypothetical protein EI94DRAFT_1769618 [Lactarius quietus]